MMQVNIYELLFNNTGTHTNDKAHREPHFLRLVVDELFHDESGQMKIWVIIEGGLFEYHVCFDGHKGSGKTPALAVKNLIKNLVTDIYRLENNPF